MADKKKLGSSNLKEDVIYQFEFPWDNYNYSPSRVVEGKTLNPQWQYSLTLKKAEIRGADGTAMTMNGPTAKEGEGEVMMNETIYWTATEAFHKQILNLNLMKKAVVNIVSKKTEAEDGRSMLVASVEMVSPGAQYPINGNCKSWNAATESWEKTSDPAWEAMKQQQGQDTNGTASTPTTETQVAPTVQAAPVDGKVEVDRMFNDAGTIVQAFNVANMAFDHPSVQAVLTQRGYSVSAEEFFTFVRGVVAGMDRAHFVVGNEEFTFPVITKDDIDFDINKIEADIAAEANEPMIMNEN